MRASPLRARVSRFAFAPIVGTLLCSCLDNQSPPLPEQHEAPSPTRGHDPTSEASHESTLVESSPIESPPSLHSRSAIPSRKDRAKRRRPGPLPRTKRSSSTAAPAQPPAPVAEAPEAQKRDVDELGPPKEDERALLQLFVNGVDQGEVAVLLRGDDVLVPEHALTRARLARALDPDPSGHVSLKTLRPSIAFTFDEDELALHLVVASELFEENVIDLRRTAPANIEYSNDASAYLNYAPRLTNGRTLDLFLELGAASGPNSFYSSAFGSLDHGFRRGLTNFTFDDPARMNRIVVGDTFVSTGPLGGGAYVGGLTLLRSFELDPYLVRTPSFDFTDSVSTPSTLEVYVNDSLVRRETLLPGTLRLANLSAPAGAGTTRYVIRDAFGYEQRLASEYYLSEGLLAEGLSDYAFSVGARRARLGTESFDYGLGPGMLLRHRLGLSRGLTLGFRAEAADDVVSGGSSMTLGSLMGQFDAALSGSSATSGNGFAALLAHTYFTRKAGISTTLRFASDSYSTLSTAPSDDRDSIQATVSGSFAWSRTLSTSMQHGVAKSRDFGLSQRTSLRSSMRLSRELSLAFTGSHWIAERSPRMLEAFLGLSWAVGSSVHASATAHVANDRAEGLVDVSKPLPTGTGYGFRASAAAGDVTRLYALGQAQGPHGRYQASYERVGGEDRTVLEASGSIVAVKGGGLFLSRPVRQSYAVVHVPEAEGVRGYLQNREIGRTSSSGKLFVPDLLPYYGNRISISDVDLPPDVGIESTERIVAPPFRGGAVVRFAARHHRYFRGHVVVLRGGDRIIPAHGEVVLEDAQRREIIPLGRQGELELEGFEKGRYSFVVEYRTASCRGDIEIPEAQDVITDLGEIVCVVPPTVRIEVSS